MLESDILRDLVCWADALNLAVDVDDAHAGEAEKALVQFFCAFGVGRSVHADALRPFGFEGIDALGKGHLHQFLCKLLIRIHIITLLGSALPATYPLGYMTACLSTKVVSDRACRCIPQGKPACCIAGCPEQANSRVKVIPVDQSTATMTSVDLTTA